MLLRKGYQQFVTEEEIEQAARNWTQKNQTVSHYGPVNKGESLSSIVTVAGLKGMTLDQRMVQVFQANLNAFLNNMNALKKGVMLSLIPHDSAVLSMSAASRIVDEHHRLWLETKVTP